MNVDTVQAVLGWCTVINLALLGWWALFIWLRRDLVYRVHTQRLNLSAQTFDALHYGGMMAYKVAIFLLNLVPYLALVLARSAAAA